MGSRLQICFLFSLLFFDKPLTSNASLHKTKIFRSQLHSQNPPKATFTPGITLFQVAKPIKVPKTKPCSSHVLQHAFGYTRDQPPVLADYKPPAHCPSQEFSKIVLELKATCKGRQFSRIFGVWLGGVELLRSCTAEPRTTGIVWTVEKDITRYSSVLKTPQTLAVYLGSVVNSILTGIYHVNVTIHFYPAEQNSRHSRYSNYWFGAPADIILPISNNLPLNHGQWFSVHNSVDTQLKEFSIPQNAYKAVLEVYVSFHKNDEYWYGNPPDEYMIANNLSHTPSNGPFREVVVSLDGNVVGAIFPFTVIYAGGLNPLLWRPITGIGSYDLPSYDIEITPSLGNILDGKQHKFGFRVTNAVKMWYIDANLHVWVDSKSIKTKGELIEYKCQPLQTSVVPYFTALNGTFETSASRSIYQSGWVKSSHGNVTTHSFQHFSFKNLMHIGNDGDLQIINQNIVSNRTIHSKLPSYIHTAKLYQSFPLYLYVDNVDVRNKSYSSFLNLSLGYNEDGFLGQSGVDLLTSSLKNVQYAQGSIGTASELGSTHQVYKYEGNDGCFFRNVSSSKEVVRYDISNNRCSRGA